MAGLDELIPDCWLFDRALLSSAQSPMQYTSNPDLFLSWRKWMCESVCQSDILRNYEAGIEKFELNFGCKFSEIDDSDSRCIIQDLVRMMGSRRHEYGVPDAPGDGEDQRFIALLRVVRYLHNSDRCFKYRQGILDLLLVPWHVVHSHFRNREVSWRFVEANAAFLFFCMMKRTGQISRLPGSSDFPKQKDEMEKLIIQQIPRDVRKEIERVEMGMLTALKWMILVFVHEFTFQDVVKIWQYVMKDGPDHFENLLSGLCAKALGLVVKKAKENNPSNFPGAIGPMLVNLRDNIRVDELL
jgi:hypothetical protein